MTTQAAPEARGAISHLDYKRVPSTLKVLDTTETGTAQGQIEAIVAVFNNVDLMREVIVPGAFGKSLQRKLPRGVWGHDWLQPIARTEEARELLPGDATLPDSLKELGGLYIRGTFNLDTQRGQEAFSDVKFGIVDEFSIGYRVLRAHRVTEEGDNEPDDPFAFFFGYGGKSTRYLDEIDCYEWSPVVAGANPATALIAAKAAGLIPMGDLIDATMTDAGAVLEAAKALLARRSKEGRTLSSANVDRLQGYADTLEQVVSGIRELLDAATPGKADATAATKAPPIDAERRAKARKLMVEFERTRAILNGALANA